MKEILIKIPEDVYKDIMTHNRERREGGKSAYYFEGLIQNGTELPKGHGRLIDADKYVKSICDTCDGMCEFVGCDCLNCHKDCRCEFAIAMDNVDVLIEADKREDK